MHLRNTEGNSKGKRPLHDNEETQNSNKNSKIDHISVMTPGESSTRRHTYEELEAMFIHMERMFLQIRGDYYWDILLHKQQIHRLQELLQQQQLMTIITPQPHPQEHYFNNSGIAYMGIPVQPRQYRDHSIQEPTIQPPNIK